MLRVEVYQYTHCLICMHKANLACQLTLKDTWFRPFLGICIYLCHVPFSILFTSNISRYYNVYRFCL